MAAIEVSAAIIYHGTRMLVCRRPPGSFFEGWWEWPGGKRRPGESPEECARRELAEETGYMCGPMLALGTVEAAYSGRNVRVSFFAGRLAPGSTAGPDAVEHRWVEPHEVASLQFLQANVPLLRALIDAPPKLP